MCEFERRKNLVREKSVGKLEHTHMYTQTARHLWCKKRGGEQYEDVVRSTCQCLQFVAIYTFTAASAAAAAIESNVWHNCNLISTFSVYHHHHQQQHSTATTIITSIIIIIIATATTFSLQLGKLIRNSVYEYGCDNKYMSYHLRTPLPQQLHPRPIWERALTICSQILYVPRYRYYGCGVNKYNHIYGYICNEIMKLPLSWSAHTHTHSQPQIGHVRAAAAAAAVTRNIRTISIHALGSYV